MSGKISDDARVRISTQSERKSVVPQRSAAFWINWLLAAAAGEIVGRALSQIFLHRSGRVIAALLLCFLAMSILQGTTRRLPRTIFWSAAFLLSLLGAVLAKTTNISMGGGDIGAIVLIAILLMFSFVICYRLAGNVPSPADCSNGRGFFWITALLAQTAASACADWIIDPGGPSARLAIAVITLGMAATIGFYFSTRMPRSILFWSAFVLSGTVAALGGHLVPRSIERPHKPDYFFGGRSFLPESMEAPCAHPSMPQRQPRSWPARPRQCGTTAVASISTRAAGSTRRTT